ncbi:MAG TPA: tRNA (guanosine(37)-N1)-methyltransferase TrmD [Candidatus Saccharimonadales bacterium]|nr:tRNA (guanosine(37)-N1)-methyltransferase TrmD [Candidatus Saccharimonadales bacterium]
MKISILTLFPTMFQGPLDISMMEKAQRKGLVEIEISDLREYGLGPRRTVDDTTYGGGDGMVLKPEPVVASIEATKSKVESRKSKVIILSPQGKKFDQAKAVELSKLDHIILVSGHYEGFDERIIEYADEELSIGDYVLTGGELPAMVVTDAVVRLLPGVLGGEQSAHVESFSDGLLEYPQYTRPVDFRGHKVPDVLQQGHHAEIEKWRHEQALAKTKRNRPDLI